MYTEDRKYGMARKVVDPRAKLPDGSIYRREKRVSGERISKEREKEVEPKDINVLVHTTNPRRQF
jgi:hypothetical protein